MSAVRRFAVIRDPALRALATRVLREYRRGPSARQNENLKHVRRMASLLQGQTMALSRMGCDAELLQIGILISDLGKEPHFIAKYSSEYGGHPFRVFMDHARVSLREANQLRESVGVSNVTWRKIIRSIIGHDGPSIEGSWWKENYERELQRSYPHLRSVEGLVHCYLDRMDQGGVYRGRGGQLNGGLRKISYDLYAKGATAGRLADVLKLIFGAIREGTFSQLRHLDLHERPRFLKTHGLPEFLTNHRHEFDCAEAYFTYVEFSDMEPDAVWIRTSAAERIRVENLDEFWRNLSRVTPERRSLAAAWEADTG